MSTGGMFMEDVITHFNTFVQATGVPPEEVHVRLTLADGSTFFIRGLKLSNSASPNGWGMIEGIGTSAPGAWIVREAHIFKVEFALAAPPPPSPIGLHTEASGR